MTTQKQISYWFGGMGLFVLCVVFWNNWNLFLVMQVKWDKTALFYLLPSFVLLSVMLQKADFRIQASFLFLASFFLFSLPFWATRYVSLPIFSFFWSFSFCLSVVTLFLSLFLFWKARTLLVSPTIFQKTICIVAFLLGFVFKRYVGMVGLGLYVGMLFYCCVFWFWFRNQKILCLFSLFSFVFLCQHVYPLPKVIEGFQFLKNENVRQWVYPVFFQKQEGKPVVLVTQQNNVVLDSVAGRRVYELMVHPVMNYKPLKQAKILVIGGEKSFFWKELHKHKEKIQEVVHIAFYEDILHLLQKDIFLLLQHSFPSDFFPPKRIQLKSFTQIIEFLIQFPENEKFDIVFMDVFPERKGSPLFFTKLYSLLAKRLTLEGQLVALNHSPYQYPHDFGCKVKTWQKAGTWVVPFQLSPIQFLDLGFVWVFKQKREPKGFEQIAIPQKVDFLTHPLPFHHFMRFSKEIRQNFPSSLEECF